MRAFGAERTELFKAAALRGLGGLFPPYFNPYFASLGTRVRDTQALIRYALHISILYTCYDPPQPLTYALLSNTHISYT